MEQDKYLELLNKKSITKFLTNGCKYCRDVNNEIAIAVSFMHNGHHSENTWRTRPFKRIFLRQFPLKNLIPEIRPILIEKNILILANADIYEYALTYKLEIKVEKREIELKIVDYPILAESFVTNEEVNGIAINY